MSYNCPTEVHSGCCDECSGTVRDNETQLFPWGLKSVCWDCLRDLEEAADAEAEDDTPPLATLTLPKNDWLAIAADILDPFPFRSEGF